MRLLIFILAFAGAVHAEDLGFRYNGTTCADSTGKTGLNPGYFGQCGDLHGATVSGVDFDNVDFSGANFEHAILSQDSFQGANLTATIFKGATLDGAKLSGASLHSTDFTGASLVNTHFAGADIQKCNFAKANFSNDALSMMSFTGSAFPGAIFVGATMDSTNFSGVDLSSADLSQANLEGAVLDGANLADATLHSTDMTGASLQGVQASGAQFNSAFLRRAHLQKADMSNGNFRNAKLDEAILTGANFQKADLRGASLAKTDLTNVDFTDAKISKSTVLPIPLDQALKLGMTLVRSGMYILWDGGAGEADTFAKALIDLGLEVTLSTVPSGKFDGTIDLSDYAVIFHFGTTDNTADLPDAGQQSLVNFVNAGGTYILTGEDAFLSSSHYKKMTDLVLFKEAQTAQSALVLSAAQGESANPIVLGLTLPLTMQSGTLAVPSLNTFGDHPPTVVLTDAAGTAAVVQREVGNGHSVEVSRCDAEYASCLNDAAFQQVIAAIGKAW